MAQSNMDIRQLAREKGAYLWEVARQHCCNDGNFSRKLRVELPESDKRAIRSIIKRIANERQK